MSSEGLDSLYGSLTIFCYFAAVLGGSMIGSSSRALKYMTGVPYNAGVWDAAVIMSMGGVISIGSLGFLLILLITEGEEDEDGGCCG